MSSNAVGESVYTRVVGYKLTKGFFQQSSPNLPMRIAILAEANEAQQSGLTADVGKEVTSAQQAGQLYGYGSPIYHIMRILRPQSGDILGGIPTIVYPQAKAGSAAAKLQTITITGPATAGGTHTVKIAGRTAVDGQTYDYTVANADTATQIAAKIADAINAVLGCPVSASAALGVVTCTAKWAGLTSNDIGITIETNDTTLGVTYAVAVTTPGSGTPAIATALTAFGNEWNTIVINSYGTVTAVLDALEAANGIADPTTPNGRYSSTKFLPFVALTGSTSQDPSSITDSRDTQMTIAICPAPGSAGLPMEAAANMCCEVAPIAQNSPELDVSGRYYRDMPTPTSITTMADYASRNSILLKGCSTVNLVSGRYQIQDFVTTYHPDGELPPAYRYCRNLILDWNVRYGYYLLELIHVVDKVLCNDTDQVTSTNIVKPKMWKSVLKSYAQDLTRRALVADVDFMTDSIDVGISSTNPDRFETFFRYKRTGTARVSSTTAEAGFNFGTA